MAAASQQLRVGFPAQEAEYPTQCGSWVPAAHAPRAGLPKGNLLLSPNHMLDCSIPFITSLLSPELCKAALCKARNDFSLGFLGFFFLFFDR